MEVCSQELASGDGFVRFQLKPDVQLFIAVDAAGKVDDGDIKATSEIKKLLSAAATELAADNTLSGLDDMGVCEAIIGSFNQQLTKYHQDMAEGLKKYSIDACMSMLLRIRGNAYAIHFGDTFVMTLDPASGSFKDCSFNFGFYQNEENIDITKKTELSLKQLLSDLDDVGSDICNAFSNALGDLIEYAGNGFGCAKSSRELMMQFINDFKNPYSELRQSFYKNNNFLSLLRAVDYYKHTTVPGLTFYADRDRLHGLTDTPIVTLTGNPLAIIGTDGIMDNFLKTSYSRDLKLVGTGSLSANGFFMQYFKEALVELGGATWVNLLNNDNVIKEFDELSVALHRLFLEYANKLGAGKTKQDDTVLAIVPLVPVEMLKQQLLAWFNNDHEGRLARARKKARYE